MSEEQSDGAENHQRHEFVLGRLEIQKTRVSFENASCLYLELCFLLQRGTNLQTNHEKMVVKGRT